MRAGLEQDVQVARAKLARADSARAGLEQSLESKVRENQELARICDELVVQIEKMGA